MIIGLIGCKGSGKDTAAEYLVLNFGFQRLAFADALYQEASAAFGVSVEFLGKRETKETPLEQLSLANCTDCRFVEVVMGTIGEWNTHYPLSPRLILQLWGTEYKRKLISESYWREKVGDALYANPDKHYIITDCRFGNEADLVEDAGGVLVRIRRPDLEEKEKRDREQGGTAAHPSEVALLTRPVFAEVFNQEGQRDAMHEDLASLCAHRVPIYKKARAA